MTNIVTRFGREFEFDDDVSKEAQDTRIQNWMAKNAPDELTKPATQGVPDTRQGEAKRNYNPILGRIAAALAAPIPGLGQMAVTPQGQQRLGDVNWYRTLAQGALPFSDEATAGVRSMIPGQPDYSTALGEERQGLKDFEEGYGPGEKMMTEVMGGLSTIPMTMGAGAALQGTRAAPWAARAGQWALSNPVKTTIGTGAVAGGAAGFGAGEGLEDRLYKAGMGAAIGAPVGAVGYAGVKGADKALGYLNTNNRVANFLRQRIKSERPSLAEDKTLDANSPDFVNRAMPELRSEINDQRRRLYTDPMMADVLPGAGEATLQYRGPNVEQLARDWSKRQYDPTLPEVAANAKSQRGRVENAFDLAFGPDTFKRSDTQLLADKKAAAQRMFTPAYGIDIRSPEIENAMNSINILSPDIVSEAKKWAQSKGRPIDRIQNGQLYYNTRYLHDIKRSLDQYIGDKPITFEKAPYLDAKKALNNAMMDQNGQYKLAMEKYAEDSALENALKMGRERAFKTGNDLDPFGGGMRGEDIRAYLAKPDVSQAEKDLFKIGAARALRENVLASSSKKFTHNWADFVNNPETAERLNALLSDKNLGSWNLLRAQLMKESENYKRYSSAIGNSKTAARLGMKDELNEADMGRLVAGLRNPGAFGATQAAWNYMMSKVNPGNRMANSVAEILGRRGATGNRQSLREIEDLLRNQDARTATYGRMGAVLPGTAAYSLPNREQR